MNIKLDISDFERLWHTGCNIEIEATRGERYSFIKGDLIEAFDLEEKLGAYYTGESYLESLAALQLLKSEDYKAGLFWDDAQSGEDPLSVWGYVIFTDMLLF